MAGPLPHGAQPGRTASTQTETDQAAQAGPPAARALAAGQVEAPTAPHLPATGDGFAVGGAGQALPDGGRRPTMPASPPASFPLDADDAPVMIWQAGPDGRRQRFNRRWRAFTGRSAAEEQGLGWAEGIHPEDRHRTLGAYRAAIAARVAFSLEYRLRGHDGAWRWVLDKGEPLQADGRLKGFLGACTDMTALHEAAAGQRRADAARASLLAELQHRVKNNIQATTSFLSLQASRAPDPAVALALRSAALRVLLASQVQDRTFHLQGGAGVALCVELATAARAAFDAAGRPGLELEIRPAPAAPLMVPASQSTPLALIVNELVVNALRHAFPEDRRGRVVLALRRLGPGKAELVVEDDGIGIPPEIRERVPRHCLGLHLVPRLARQARGAFRIEGPPGTRAVISFRLA